MIRDLGHIWPWKFKDQGHCQGKTHWSQLRPGIHSICLFSFRSHLKIQGQAHGQSLKFNRYVCFSFHGNRTILAWDIANYIFDHEKSSQGHGQGQSWRSHLLEFNRYVCFSSCCNWAIFGWDIANSMFDLENSRSRSQTRSNPMIKFEA